MRAERSQRSDLGGGAPRPRSAAPRPRGAEPDDWSYDGPAPRAPYSSRPAPGRDARPAPRRTARRSAPPQRGVAGALGVLGVFLVTLAAGAADSYLGTGLGLITTIALVGSTVAAGFLVRRRDLATVVVAPPLVFVGVALVNIVLAPSATLSLPTIATLLIRGFPAMAIAVGAALVVALVRAVSRR
ncbi:DUF6542 domain-containing protein [Klenkia taihuensis]|uniref:DUF6542 domain-containing protein n=1 Tax=Klenkia taihuensis TaxID=1225127 RepID=A0A1I1MH02_9ACTN|nr:DUF6542 domain-containing protein [Klenkia taihuensis]GHE14293.1 hypothetical protein GCM10011381_40230 [Klenkia taihuensis]SFC84709.1 hypothetical protein SAMN05661030_1686 [Klenkia taihuensis]